MSDQYPGRNPLACGALGRYDPMLVAEIGRRLASEMSTVHEDGRAILLLDHPATRWRARRSRGLAWSEGRPAKRSVASWQDAACELAACGLVFHGERRRLHSSVSGVAPIYHVERLSVHLFNTVALTVMIGLVLCAIQMVNNPFRGGIVVSPIGLQHATDYMLAVRH